MKNKVLRVYFHDLRLFLLHLIQLQSLQWCFLLSVFRWTIKGRIHETGFLFSPFNVGAQHKVPKGEVVTAVSSGTAARSPWSWRGENDVATMLASEARLVRTPRFCPPPAHGGNSSGREHRKWSLCSTSNRLPALLHWDINLNLVCSEMTAAWCCQENPAPWNTQALIIYSDIFWLLSSFVFCFHLSDGALVGSRLN